MGQDADLCGLVTEVWLVCFSRCIADCFCLLMGGVSRLENNYVLDEATLVWILKKTLFLIFL